MRISRRNGIVASIFIIGFMVISLVVLFFLFTAFFLPAASGKCVGVVRISGPLTTESVEPTLFSDGVLGSEEIAQRISELENRSDISALVFYISSPGGTITASKDIYSAMDGISKPKVAFLREQATSGAYYISLASDKIVSEPYAVVGNIGVISLRVDATNLLNKVGLNISSVKSGEHKDMGAFYRKPTPEEDAMFSEVVNGVFEDFKNLVIVKRGINEDSPVFDGRIFLGKDALKYGLVDKVGTLHDAVKLAADLAGLKKYRTCEVDLYSGNKKGLFDFSSFYKSFVIRTTYGYLEVR